MIWTEIVSPAPSFDPHLSLFKGYALQMKSLEYRIDKSSHGSIHFSEWFDGMVRNARRSFALVKSSEWEKLIRFFDSFIGIFTRKLDQARTSSDYASAWSSVTPTLSMSEGPGTNSTTAERTKRWQEVAQVLLRHGMDPELLGTKYPGICQDLSATSNARPISVESDLDSEDEGGVDVNWYSADRF